MDELFVTKLDIRHQEDRNNHKTPTTWIPRSVSVIRSRISQLVDRCRCRSLFSRVPAPPAGAGLGLSQGEMQQLGVDQRGGLRRPTTPAQPRSTGQRRRSARQSGSRTGQRRRHVVDAEVLELQRETDGSRRPSVRSRDAAPCRPACRDRRVVLTHRRRAKKQWRRSRGGRGGDCPPIKIYAGESIFSPPQSFS